MAEARVPFDVAFEGAGRRRFLVELAASLHKKIFEPQNEISRSAKA